MQERHLNKEKYFEEQSYTTERFVIPYISPYLNIGPGLKVLEIGCGEGGNLKPFLDEGCMVYGIDLSESKIANGKRFFATHPNSSGLTLICEDIYNLPAPGQPFDLIIMRDVIEHIHDQEKFMRYVKQFLNPKGLFFLAFPPWQNPFGGHQQICGNRYLARMPWIHLLPRRLYTGLLKWGGEPSERMDALLEIRDTGLSLERFEKILRAERYEVVQKDFYLVNPNYEVKFGLSPRKTPGIIGRIPYLRNFLVTTAYYLIRM
jgi:SAM-dependent methyltransferase